MLFLSLCTPCGVRVLGVKFKASPELGSLPFIPL